MISDAERAAVAEVLQGPILTHGTQVRAFESAFAQFTGAPHALATNSCTAAMHLAWMALGVGPGDEVIVPAQTHVATAHAVELAGARCCFVDVDPATGNMDLERFEAAITSKTRAVVVVHYLGLPVEMPRVIEIARDRGLAVVEDCALAVGSRLGDTHVGLQATLLFGNFSRRNRGPVADAPPPPPGGPAHYPPPPPPKEGPPAASGGSAPLQPGDLPRADPEPAPKPPPPPPPPGDDRPLAIPGR